MRVTVRLFARLRDEAGCDRVDCALRDGASAGDAWQAAVARFPALAPFSGAITCAINADFARLSATVHEGDEVAFLPPVSGGADRHP